MIKRLLFTLLIPVSCIGAAHALIINEIMSNPVGDDGGREWIELYNDLEESVELSTLTISIKGGAPIVVTPLSGGTTVAPHEYVIIGSVVSGATKFLQDYPMYNGLLFKSSISLVNTGITSIDVRLHGNSASNISSYTAAKEGYTYAMISGSYALGSPTPGKENQADSSSPQNETPDSTTTSNQTTVPQMSPPSADIILYLPKDKLVVAGAPAVFTVSSLTTAGKALSNMNYLWAFGDGGQKTGSSTQYRYLYPGRYIAQVEGANGIVAGTARMNVRVVSPEVSLSKIETGKYGKYIRITNPNSYDLDISDWKLSIDGAVFPFPKNTLLGVGETLFSGHAMGFSSSTISSSTIIKILFPTMEEFIRVPQVSSLSESGQTALVLPQSSATTTQTKQIVVSSKKLLKQQITPKVGISTSSTSTAHIVTTRKQEKDVRLATWIKTFFTK